MTQIATIFAFAALCSVLPQPIGAQSTSSSQGNAEEKRPAPLGVNAILTELKLIRLELLSQRLESFDQLIADLNRELDRVNPKEADQEEELLRLQVAELDERIESARATEDRSALQQTRAQTISTGAERLRARQQDGVQREKTIRERLTQAQRTQEYIRGGIAHLQNEFSKTTRP